MVLVDTSVWSLALRRGTPNDGTLERELTELIREGRVAMVGPVRQELLSGIRTLSQYQRLRDSLRAFADIPLTHEDYESAASCCNRCRAKGIQGSSVDFLLCSVSLRRSLPIFTTDADFANYSPILGLTLHHVRAELA